MWNILSWKSYFVNIIMMKYVTQPVHTVYNWKWNWDIFAIQQEPIISVDSYVNNSSMLEPMELFAEIKFYVYPTYSWIFMTFWKQKVQCAWQAQIQCLLCFYNFSVNFISTWNCCEWQQDYFEKKDNFKIQNWSIYAWCKLFIIKMPRFKSRKNDIEYPYIIV